MNEQFPVSWTSHKLHNCLISSKGLHSVNLKCSVSPYVPANITIRSTYRDFCALPVVYSPLLSSSTAALNQFLCGTCTKHTPRIIFMEWIHFSSLFLIEKIFKITIVQLFLLFFFFVFSPFYISFGYMQKKKEGTDTCSILTKSITW